MLHKIIESVGYVMILLGAGGIESDPMIVPGMMAIAGLGLVGVEVLWERRREKNEHRRKLCTGE